MATTKTRTTTSAVESENIQALAAAQASGEAFAAAQELAANRQTAHDNAEMAEAEMEDQFAQGIDHATAIDYATALAETLRTEMLHNAAERAEKAAQAAVVNTDVTLSLMALPWVQSALKGVEVVATFYAPTTSPEQAAAYVIQRTPTINLGGGSVGGKIEVRYYRPDLYRAVDAGDIQAAAEQAHCTILAASSGSQGYGDNMKVDTVQIDIKRGQSVVPLISTPPTSRQASSHVAHAFGADLAAHCKAKTDGPVRGINGEYVGAAVTVKPLTGEVVSTDVDDAGVRTTTVQLNLTYHREGDRALNVDKHLREVLADWQGSFVPSFGTVSSIKGNIGFPDQMVPPSTTVTVEVVFASASR